MFRNLLILFVFLLSACKSEPTRLEISGETMGTTYNIVALDRFSNFTAEDLKARVESTLADVNATMSNWDPKSEISQFNESEALEPVKISKALSQVLDAAHDVHRKSEGQFDITLGPLIELWGFGTRTTDSPVPSDKEIARALKAVGQTKVLIYKKDPQTLAKTHPDTSVYLAAIAKGYGVDQVARMLKALGIKDYMVEIGGDLVTAGNNPGGVPWQIGIERPDAARGVVQDIVKVADLGMATSGDYRNYFEDNGQRYSHIIDAQTGRPVTHKTASVTVLAKNAMLADAWATALLALGVERGMKIAETFDLAALFIARDSSGKDVRFTTKATSHFTKLQSKH